MTNSPPDGTATYSTADPRRWSALKLLGLVQFMMVLDTTVVNVALPQIQADLRLTNVDLAWVVNGYIVMAGGLLLLGGRLADLAGRRRLFMTGVALFAIASASCAAATVGAVLIASRFAQGAGAAMASPAALGLLALLFTDRDERVKALGMWGGIAGIAGVLGTVLSGVITDFVSWRLVFLIDVPVCAVALVLICRFVSEGRGRRPESLDVPGALASTAGLTAIIYGLLQVVRDGWGSPTVLIPILVGVALLGVTIAIELRSAAPLLPPSFFTHRVRLAANASALLLAASFFSFLFLMTLFEQRTLRYSPLESGFSYLPFGLAIGAGVGMGMKMVSKQGPRPALVAGFIDVRLVLVCCPSSQLTVRT